MAGTKFYLKKPNLSYTPFADTEEGQAKNTALSDALKNYNNYGDHNWANEGVYQQWLNKKLNRDPFSYDLNADALYQQYKDKYIQQGKLAMEDTIGQASAMTGGYGNSYAATVGKQAYQEHLEELNDVIPELYNMALNKYNMDGQEIDENLALLDADYNKSLGEWQIGYGQLKDKLDVANSDFYNSADLYGSEQKLMNSIAQENYENEWRQAEWDESMRRYELEKLSSGIIATGGGSNYDNGSLSTEQIKELQRAIGATPDGYYGANSKKAAGGLSAEEAYNKYVGVKGWKDFDEGTLKDNQAELGGSYYRSAHTDVDAMIAAGKSYNDLMSYAQEMVGNSFISQSEYMTLIQYIRKRMYG